MLLCFVVVVAFVVALIWKYVHCTYVTMSERRDLVTEKLKKSSI